MDVVGHVQVHALTQLGGMLVHVLLLVVVVVEWDAQLHVVEVVEVQRIIPIVLVVVVVLDVAVAVVGHAPTVVVQGVMVLVREHAVVDVPVVLDVHQDVIIHVRDHVMVAVQTVMGHVAQVVIMDVAQPVQILVRMDVHLVQGVAQRVQQLVRPQTDYRRCNEI